MILDEFEILQALREHGDFFFPFDFLLKVHVSYLFSPCQLWRKYNLKADLSKYAFNQKILRNVKLSKFTHNVT